MPLYHVFMNSENCNSGICQEIDDTWQCVCPINATGIRCEVPVLKSVDSLGFTSDFSFVSMPSPQSLDNIHVSLSVKPEDVKTDHMVMYMGSSYDPDSKERMSVSVMDGAFVYSYTDGEGHEALRSSPIQAGVEYTVEFLRNESKTMFRVNEEVLEHEVNVNNKELNFNNHSAFSSGDVSACPKGGELFPIKIFTTEDESCLWRACVDHDCGENGNCIPLNQSSFKCQCKLYYDGTRCDVFKPIERAAMFDGTAFLEISSDEFPHLTSEKDEVVEFKFKTRESDGVLFWQGQQPGTSVVGEDYFSVGLSNGHLQFA
ncbi:unnamed protein product [Heligmosomoides polygyrus]|uniref:EGF-like domain-containing protein n=1 Tax=Heligmosomoides polygyrus TaxID=6339 RepID=A0A3P8G0I5_HELPZ|nr:unnamed protein product [Heligmosomoides polygyrus]